MYLYDQQFFRTVLHYGDFNWYIVSLSRHNIKYGFIHLLFDNLFFLNFISISRMINALKNVILKKLRGRNDNLFVLFSNT